MGGAPLSHEGKSKAALQQQLFQAPSLSPAEEAPLPSPGSYRFAAPELLAPKLWGETQEQSSELKEAPHLVAWRRWEA